MPTLPNDTPGTTEYERAGFATESAYVEHKVKLTRAQLRVAEQHHEYWIDRRDQLEQAEEDRQQAAHARGELREYLLSRDAAVAR